MGLRSNILELTRKFKNSSHLKTIIIAVYYAIIAMNNLIINVNSEDATDTIVSHCVSINVAAILPILSQSIESSPVLLQSRVLKMHCFAARCFNAQELLLQKFSL